LTENPPPYDIIATVKILGTQLHFTGSFSNGINSLDYDTENAFVVEDYKIVMKDNNVDKPIDFNKVCTVQYMKIKFKVLHLQINIFFIILTI